MKKVYFVKGTWGNYVSENDLNCWLKQRSHPDVFQTENRKAAFDLRNELRKGPRQFAGMNEKAKVVSIRRK